VPIEKQGFSHVPTETQAQPMMKDQAAVGLYPPPPHHTSHPIINVGIQEA